MDSKQHLVGALYLQPAKSCTVGRSVDIYDHRPRGCRVGLDDHLASGRVARHRHGEIAFVGGRERVAHSDNVREDEVGTEVERPSRLRGRRRQGLCRDGALARVREEVAVEDGVRDRCVVAGDVACVCSVAGDIARQEELACSQYKRVLEYLSRYGIR